jgi:serralysin
MRNAEFSRLPKESVSRNLLFICVLALLTIGATTGSTVFPTGVQAVAPQVENIPQTCTEVDPTSLGAAGRKDLFWKNKDVLRVRFLGGSKTLQEQVRDYAPLWTQDAGIQFVFVESEPSDIRVSFIHDGTSWSYIGSSAKYVNKEKATMNFGWFDERTTDKIFRRTILHEFGHALGLVHEHQSPATTIHWNKGAVYQYYSERFDWNENVVDDNIFRKYRKTQTQYTTYDPNSIMHYPIPAKFTTDGTSVEWNTKLSPMDIAFIKEKYPPKAHE